MKNFTSKSLHHPPSVTNAFKKSDRVYPEPISLMVKDPIKMIEEPQHTFHFKTPPIIAHTKTQTQKFSFIAKDSFVMNDPYSENRYVDDECIWFYNLPKNLEGRKREITFNQTEFIISGWTEDNFPSIFFICIDGFPGFCDKYGNVTDRVASLKIAEVQATELSVQLRSYEIRYVLKENIKWEIPKEITQLRMTIKTDQSEEPITLPLSNPMFFDFEISFE